MRRGHGAGLLALLWGLGALAHSQPGAAADAAAASASATGETAKVKPRGERQLGAVARPTVQKKSDAAAKAKRAGRVSMQIPTRLRAALERQIEQRIERD